MSLNSSSTNCSSSSACLDSRAGFFIFLIFCITNILLLLPLCIAVLYLGVHRWWTRRSVSTMTSHSDIFTYHMVAVEMLGILGCGLYSCGAGFNASALMDAGSYLISISSNGQLFFHVLSCMERHLAVVRPITYLGLKKRSRVRLRNIILGCVWLLFLGTFCLIFMPLNHAMIPAFSLTVVSILVVAFCSLSALRALIRPGPGDGGRSRFDHTKMRAFHTILAIMGALLFRFVGHMMVIVMFFSLTTDGHGKRWLLSLGVWFSVPSSLVLPLLFLHRAGKLLCCRKETRPGHESE